MRYYCEKLQRRNVTKDVKHYEDCEQFLLSLGKCFTIEALIQFFGLESQDSQPTKHTPPSNIKKMEKQEIEKYCEDVLDEFINQFLLTRQMMVMRMTLSETIHYVCCIIILCYVI